MIIGLLKEMVILPAKQTKEKLTEKVENENTPILTKNENENENKIGNEDFVRNSNDKNLFLDEKKMKDEVDEMALPLSIPLSLPLEGKNVVFTGKLERMTRSQAEEVCVTLGKYVMLCYVMLCYVMLCYVMLCYVMLC